jgi:predicted nucleic acid-binding protein
VKYVLDTNVYVELLRDPEEFTRAAHRLERILPQTWLSSVVLHEMLSGARGDLGRAAISRAVRTLTRVGRLLTPTHADWALAGTVRSRIWERHPDWRTKILQNDLLIACSAYRFGAYVVTKNRKDFQAIAAEVPVEFGSLNDIV